MGDKITILQVNSVDKTGGAANVAWNLFDKYNNLGHDSYFVVGNKQSLNNKVFHLPRQAAKSVWQKIWFYPCKKLEPLVGKIPGIGKLKSAFQYVAWPKSFLDRMWGTENFNFSGTKILFEILPKRPDILHLHNLHSDYFDIRMLPQISKLFPTIITLHDAWLLGGHCAHSFDCNKWKTGCGKCPSLSLYPSLKKDTTQYNWKRKKEIYLNSSLYIATPCKWLMDRVEQSILNLAAKEKRVIPNGVDLEIFKPKNKNIFRERLKITDDAFIILLVGNSPKSNEWKDYRTFEEAIAKLSRQQRKNPIIVLCVGENAPSEKINDIEVKFIPYEKDAKLVANYYQAADLLVHSTKIDTFPNTVLEALACGLPTVATAVGGILEQIRDGETGFLVEKENSDDLAKAILRIYDNNELRSKMAELARKDAEDRFSLSIQTKNYLDWYREILTKWANFS